MKWALVNENNIVIDVIEYDGVSPLDLPDNITVTQINDWLNEGDNVNDPPPPLDDGD